ncbi:hypothetical protein BN7_542 [Wickerhamomyces ciferrii]|uniref:F-box domain-containing protein n=1 Tax=Wickerhamomyces ciferrii (strain ATCC 14091 / BCRC 22168 / CBS 111 / JCM 3599 / NBRC 0793 / NRRL Y-1031 F-60-10) TaxID=1206466 RepID=K0K855_WICCF|nr:uncharacterized protein BN7_542 [Wickerhamomyces ciferrii]CCH41005.1 hypothetical protein BN7_542 [Wickerhamomyces ciferrii]
MSPSRSKLRKQQKEFNALLNFPDEILHLIMDNLKSLDLLNYVRAVPKLQNDFKENYRVFTDCGDKAEFSFLSNRYCFKLGQSGKKRNVDKFQIFNGTVMFEIFGNHVRRDRGYPYNRDEGPINETNELIENIAKINTNGVMFSVKAHEHTSFDHPVIDLINMSNNPVYSLKYLSLPKLEYFEFNRRVHTINTEITTPFEGVTNLKISKYQGVANLNFYPNLKNLTIENVKELSFEKSSVFPEVLELNSFHEGILFTSSMCEKLKYLYINLSSREANNNSSTHGLKDLEFPNLIELEIRSGQIINEIKNISAPLLKKFTVIASYLELGLEKLSFPVLESIYISSKGLNITNIESMMFPQLESFEIGYTPSTAYDTTAKSNHDISKLPLHFLRNARKGEIYNCHHIIESLDMVNLEELCLRGAPVKEYPTNAQFNKLKSLEISRDKYGSDKNQKIPKLVAPNLQYLKLKACQVSKDFFDQNSSNYVNQLVCQDIPALDISDTKLPHLEVLDINDVDSEVNLSNCHLPSLTKLIIQGHKEYYGRSKFETHVILPELSLSPELENIDISYVKKIQGQLTNKDCPKLVKLRFFKCKNDPKIEILPQGNLETIIIDTSVSDSED